MGRPCKLTPAVQEVICKHVAAGHSLQSAAAIAEVGRSDLTTWVGVARGTITDRPMRKEYIEFAQAVEKAQAEHQNRLLGIIERAADMPQHWTAAAWIMERRYPDAWGRRERLDVKLGPDDEYKAMLDQLKSLAGSPPVALLEEPSEDPQET